MKKILSFALVLVMVLTMSVTAFAADNTLDNERKTGTTEVTHTVSDSYIVTIPDSMTVGTDATVSASDVTLAKGYNLAVSVSSAQYDNGWKLKNNGEALGYTLKIGDKDVANNGIILTAESGGTETKTLVTALDGTAKYSGSYTDTLTFSVTLKEPYSYDATSATAEELKEAVTAALNSGSRSFSIKMSPNADESMMQAIGQGMVAAGVEESSVNLTLNGLTRLPAGAFYDSMNNIIYGKGLKTLTLPDATEIGQRPFYESGLVNVFAPKVTIVKPDAFDGCKELTSVNLPNVKELGSTVFSGCVKLTSLSLPNATIINRYAFTLSHITSLTLTAEGTFTLGNEILANVNTNNIDLVLNTDKQSEVTDGNTWQGYTFKSITFVDSNN